MNARLRYLLLGYSIAGIICFILWGVTGKLRGASIVLITVNAGNLTLLWAQKTGRAPLPETRPLTLFPDGIPAMARPAHPACGQQPDSSPA